MSILHLFWQPARRTGGHNSSLTYFCHFVNMESVDAWSCINWSGLAPVPSYLDLTYFVEPKNSDKGFVMSVFPTSHKSRITRSVGNNGWGCKDHSKKMLDMWQTLYKVLNLSNCVQSNGLMAFNANYVHIRFPFVYC